LVLRNPKPSKRRAPNHAHALMLSGRGMQLHLGRTSQVLSGLEQAANRLPHHAMHQQPSKQQT